MMKRPSCNTSSPLAALALLLLLLLVCFFHCAAAARLLPAVPPLVHQDGLVLQEGAAVNGDELSVSGVRTEDAECL
uniref:Trans-sialidase n=1 Tax=Setaria viridis TaxID=4556 RepID=A0A4U6TE37_SETVI|nr:hypothetical protein SEVIR_8G027000v2 [Setaria viridis]